MSNCPDCQFELLESWSYCPECGEPISHYVYEPRDPSEKNHFLFDKATLDTIFKEIFLESVTEMVNFRSDNIFMGILKK